MRDHTVCFSAACMAARSEGEQRAEERVAALLRRELAPLSGGSNAEFAESVRLARLVMAELQRMRTAQALAEDSRRTLRSLPDLALRHAADDLRESAKVWEYNAGELAGTHIGAQLEARALGMRRVAQVLEEERLSR